MVVIMRNVISPKDIKPGQIIKDKAGYSGIVIENMHPWGFPRLQYDGFTIVNHEDPEWYELINDTGKCEYKATERIKKLKLKKEDVGKYVHFCSECDYQFISLEFGYINCPNCKNFEITNCIEITKEMLNNEMYKMQYTL